MRLIVTVSVILGCGLALPSETFAFDVSDVVGSLIKQSTRNVGDAGAEFLAQLKIRLEKYLASELNFDIGFYLYTPSNPEEEYNLQQNSSLLKDSPFDNKLETKFIVHDYLATLPPNASIFYGIKKELLQEGNYNVIIVDWTQHNNGLYSDVSLNAFIVGLEISKLIQFLTINTGISSKSVHIIGHGLGAQAGGFAGKTTRNLGRITALDASGPIFQFLPPSLRIFHTDAIFVDAIHTNGALVESEGYGTLAPYGNIDFFPTGGSQNPECTLNRELLDINGVVVNMTTSLQLLQCNHDYSTFIFLFTIRILRCQSYFCSSYSSFLREECPRRTSDQVLTIAEMGFPAKPIPSLPAKSKFFLDTAADCKLQGLTK